MNYYELIKQELINNEIYKKVKDYSKNRSDLKTYYNVGKMLIEAQGGKERATYGEQIIKEYSKQLCNEVGKQYNYKNLFKMRKFYLFLEKFPTLSRQLTWSHYIELLKFDDIDILYYYVDICLKQNLSVRELRKKIKSNEYERLDEKTKTKLITTEDTKIEDFIKNPIVLKSNLNREKITEKALHNMILENMKEFLKELGDDFCYISDEYKIKIGDRFNYIDFLLYNIKFNCYVIIELKITEFKAEHVGQIKKYMTYIDKNLKKINQEDTIGIIICRKDNEFIMEYCSDERIFKTTYELV